MPGIIGRKIGMTSIYSAEGKAMPCTVIEAGPCVVTQVKTEDRDGYEAVQLGFGDRKEKNTPNSLKGHFKKAKTDPKAKLAEFKGFEEANLGDVINVDIFEEGEYVSVVGTSKGKGFQGLLKDMASAVLDKQLTVNTTDCVLQVQLVQHLIQHVYLKECEWADTWVTSV